MDKYVTGSVIRKLREKGNMTQEELANRLFVSSKAVSKWETGQGFPDISLIEPLSNALGISVIELLSGENIINKNRAYNLTKSRFYVCPVCGNVVFATGDTVISCCGITLPPLSEENDDKEHLLKITVNDGEYYVTVSHPMKKDHYISFIAAVSDSGMQLVKLYPESDATARFRIDSTVSIYAYCNRHGLFKQKPGL